MMKQALSCLLALFALRLAVLPVPSQAGGTLDPKTLQGTWMASEDGIGIVLRLESRGFTLELGDLELGGFWLYCAGELLLHYSSGTVHVHPASIRGGTLHIGEFMRLMRIGGETGRLAPRPGQRPAGLGLTPDLAPELDKGVPAG